MFLVFGPMAVGRKSPDFHDPTVHFERLFAVHGRPCGAQVTPRGQHASPGELDSVGSGYLLIGNELLVLVQFVELARLPRAAGLFPIPVILNL